MNETTQYIFFFSSLALSIVVGSFLLIRYWMYEIIRLAGWYTIKPIIVALVGMLIPISIIYEYYQYQPIVGVEIIFLIIIVSISWKSYRVGWGIPWVMLIVDILRLTVIYVPSLAYSYATNVIYYLLMFFPAIFVTFFRKRLIETSF